MLEIITDQLSTSGGPVLIALLLVSVVATATTFFKLVQFARLGVGRRKVPQQAMVYWHGGDRGSAYQLVAADRGQLSSVLAAAMAILNNNPRDITAARQAATQRAVESLGVVSKYLRIVESVVQAAPMMGLLGTVLGMIEAFGKVSQGGGAADPSALAGGIWTALTTTALGLAIAIPFYFISIWLESRVESERAAMDAAISDVTRST
jgi:biopolymer transport protein ExbB